MKPWKYRVRVLSALLLSAPFGCAASTHERTTSQHLDAIERRYHAEGRKQPASPDTSDDEPVSSSLDAYLRLALRKSPRARAAFERWKSETLKVARARRLPDPQLRYTYFLQSVETRVGPQRHKFSLSQVFPWPSKLSEGSAAQAGQAAAAEQGFNAIVLDLREQVSHAYWELWLVHEVHRLKSEHDLVLETLAEATRARVATNQASLADLNQVELKIAHHHDHTEEHHELARATSARLNAAVGITPATPIMKLDAEPQVGLPRHTLAQLRELASQHPQVARHSMLESASYREADAQSADRLPNFVLGADYVEVGPAVNAGVSDSGKDAFSVTVGVSVPLWQSSVSDAEEAAFAKARAYGAEREQALLSLQAEVAGVLADVRNSERKIRLYRDSLIPQAQATYQSVLGGYQAGRSSVSATLMAQGDLLELGLALATQQSLHERAWAKLEQVVGSQLEREPSVSKAVGADVETSGKHSNVRAQEAETKHVEPREARWTCPMHSQVVRAGPGSCPICGMDLIRKKESAP